MEKKDKKIFASFFEFNNGKEPVREWLLSLNVEDRKKIGKDIFKVEHGWPVGMPYSRPIGRGLYEVRSTISDGCIARVLFCIKNNKMILLHGFIKKTQVIPDKEKDIAYKRMKDLL